MLSPNDAPGSKPKISQQKPSKDKRGESQRYEKFDMGKYLYVDYQRFSI